MSTIPIGPVIIESIIVIGLIAILILSLSRYRKRKSTITLRLILTYLFYFLGSLTSFTGRSIVYFGSYPPVFTHPFSLTGVIFTTVGNLFIVAFTQQLFFKKDRIVLFVISVLIGLNIGFMLYVNVVYPVYEQGGHETIMTSISGGINAFVSLVCYLVVFYYSFREARKTDDIIRKRTAEAISLYGILIAVAFTFLVFDALPAEQFGHYTVYYYICWAIFPFAILLSFIGYFQPSWFKRIVSNI